MKTAAPEQILIVITQTNSPGLHCYDQHDLQFRLSETHWVAEVMKGNLWLWIMSEKPKMAARLFGTGQAPVQTHLCLPSDCLLGVESTRTATTPITVRKTIHKDPCLQTRYLKNSVTWPSLHEKGMGWIMFMQWFGTASISPRWHTGEYFLKRMLPSTQGGVKKRVKEQDVRKQLHASKGAKSNFVA